MLGLHSAHVRHEAQRSCSRSLSRAPRWAADWVKHIAAAERYALGLLPHVSATNVSRDDSTTPEPAVSERSRPTVRTWSRCRLAAGDDLRKLRWSSIQANTSAARIVPQNRNSPMKGRYEHGLSKKAHRHVHSQNTKTSLALRNGRGARLARTIFANAPRRY